jgi:DNA-binding transcriptional MerR regulator
MAEIVRSVKTASHCDYSLADLQQMTGYSGRTIARYIQMGLVPSPKQAGSRTRYSREALGRLLAIAKLRREGKEGTPDVKYELRRLTDEEVEAHAEAHDPLVQRAALLPAGTTQRWVRVSPRVRDCESGGRRSGGGDRDRVLER